MEPGQTFFQRRHANVTRTWKRCFNDQESTNYQENATKIKMVQMVCFSAGTETGIDNRRYDPG